MEVSVEQFEYLVSLAMLAVGGVDPNLKKIVQDIEETNGITRNYLLVQWQESGEPLPQGTRFPHNWPPVLRASIQKINTPITKEDIDTLLRARARNPVSILLTKDAAGVVGWVSYESKFGVPYG